MSDPRVRQGQNIFRQAIEENEPPVSHGKYGKNSSLKGIGGIEERDTSKRDDKQANLSNAITYTVK